MKPSTTLLLLLLLGVSSCVTSYKMNVINVELMQPPALPHIEKIDTIALFSRDICRLDTSAYLYFNHSEPLTDTAIHYIDNYNACIGALAEMLVREGSFACVINCRDSLNKSIRTGDTVLYARLFHTLGADALVFLDRYKLNDFQYKKGDFGSGEITGNFKEFIKSDYLANIWGSLLWTVRIKGDTARYETLQMDDLYYGNSVYPEFFGSKEKHKRMLDNTSVYFGKQFAEKLIPSWQQAERGYYICRDSLMQKGAQHCMSSEWLKAAETYKRIINNKNRRLASRAAYNMALVCEMSGEMDAAIDWLTRSEATCQQDDTALKNQCREYLQLLMERQKEMELLNKLMRKKAAYKNSNE